MVSKPSAALAAKMKADVPQVPEDKLEKARDYLRQSRDLDKEVRDLAERLKERQASLLTLKQKTLPDFFNEIGIDNLGLPAEGNLPAYDAKLVPYYHANIGADWDTERQEAAFGYLAAQEGGEAMIKTVITVELGRGDRKVAEKVEAALDKIKVPYSRKLGVPWNTLTAWVKEQIERHKTTPDLNLLGATVGSVVNLKERKTNG